MHAALEDALCMACYWASEAAKDFKYGYVSRMLTLVRLLLSIFFLVVILLRCILC